MDRIGEFLPFMLEGSVTTVQVFIFTLVISLPLGLPIALGSNSRFKPLSFLCKIYVWIFRGTPLMLQLWFFYFFFPFNFGITLDALSTAILTYVLNYALGLSKGQTMKDIILPQTMKAIMPPVVNEAITLVKDTALVSSIAVIDLMKATNSAVNRMTSLTPFFYAAVIYLIMTFVLTIIAGRLEKHFSRYDAKEDW